jgi:hypothetical protein
MREGETERDRERQRDREHRDSERESVLNLQPFSYVASLSADREFAYPILFLPSSFACLGADTHSISWSSGAAS